MKKLAATAAVLILSGCTLYNEVEVRPLTYDPTKIERGSDIQGMLRKFDLNRAVQSASLIEQRKPAAAELGALGAAEVAAGRYADARRHLRAAIDLEPFRTVYAALAWNLSELEYMSNNYDASLDWARIAAEHGINVKQWHLEYLAALSNVDAYHFSGAAIDRLVMRMGRPDVPRVDVRVNETHTVNALIDSGAVISIMSEGLAGQLQVRRLGTIEGSFAGLLGEPIPVHFGVLDHLDIGAIKIANVPIAIMPDEKMKFLVAGKKEFHIDFLLGANLLKEFRLELDFRHNTVAFAHLKPADRVPQPDQNLFWQQFRPAVRGTINRHGWFLFVLDTGSEVTFLNHAEDPQRHPAGTRRLQETRRKDRRHRARDRPLGWGLPGHADVRAVRQGADVRHRRRELPAQLHRHHRLRPDARRPQADGRPRRRIRRRAAEGRRYEAVAAVVEPREARGIGSVVRRRRARPSAYESNR
jgi:tetratricopeptide (TPR) repeat protein